MLDANPPNPGPDSSPELVVVFEANDRVQLAMAKGLLDDARIPYFAVGEIDTLVQGVNGFLRKWVRLQVPKACEREARELLQQLLLPIPEEPSEPEA
jgi:hypothetical protein